jgi:DNA transformation protein and related proteins
MAYDEGLVAWVQEGLEPLGAVTMRKMMGAATLYLDGIIFAIADDQLWFKSDAESDAEWDAAGCERFTFTSKDGRVETMNYRRAPDGVYDDADELQRWARLAAEAGRRGAVKKRPRKG